VTKWLSAAAKRRLARIAGRAIACSLVLLTVTSCAPGTITRKGDEVHHLWMAYLIAAIVVMVLEGGAIIVFVLAFRERRGRPGDGPVPQIHGHNRLEVTWTVIPAILLFTLLGISLHEYEQVNANPAPALTINVTAYQWQWTFAYANGSGKSLHVTEQAKGQDQGPVLYLPVGEPIRFVLRSADVIHSFYVPAMFYKRDVIPGRVNIFTQQLDPSSAGHRYTGACAELCGMYHGDMRFTVAPLTQSAFQAWLAAQHSSQSQAASCSPNGASLSVTAKSIHFSSTCLAAPAGKPFTITFTNTDSGVPHNIAIYSSQAATKVLFRGQLITGPKTVTYHVPALPAGTYYFRCDVHPTAMHGTFIVK
jgi:cytochrome c oxidase subunit 2